MGLDLNWPTGLAEHASDGFRVSGADDLPIPQPASGWITVGVGIANEKRPKILVIQLERAVTGVARRHCHKIEWLRIWENAFRGNVVPRDRPTIAAIDAIAKFTLLCQ